jgi:hypothetical protein
MINHYESALQKFIEEQKNKPSHFFAVKDAEDSTQATWSDMFFFHEAGNLKRHSVSIFNRYLYPNEMIKTHKQFARLTEKENALFHSYYHDICKALTVFIEEKRKKAGYHFVPKEHCHYFQKWIGWMQEKSLKIYQYTPSKHRDFMSWLMDGSLKPNSEYVEESKILAAIKTLQSVGAIDDLLLFKPLASVAPDRTLAKVSRRLNKKMPSDEDIAVALSIFHKIMPETDEEIDIYENTRNRYVASAYMLSLAATQRFAAENPYLTMYSLSSRESSDGQEVYNLTFPGSKGFGVNKKHVHGPLIPFVEKAINFLIQSGAPARALTRYYENQDLPANNILFGIKIDDWKGVDPEKPLDLWKLGSLLGLYEELPESVTSHLKKIKGYPFSVDSKAPFQSLSQKFALLGLTIGDYKNPRIKSITAAETPKQLEQEFIAHLKKMRPNFPYRLHANGNLVLLKDALTIFTGRQLNSKGSWPLSTSIFAIDSTEYAEVFRTAISPYKYSNAGLFFTSNGYSAEVYGVTPHMIRHYSNTIYQESEVSDEHIAIASGRVDIRTNADYDHLTNDEIAFRMSRHTEQYKDYSYIHSNVITANAYQELTKRAATDTGVGLCLQDLSESPCTHLSDFKYHCADCTKAAFCKGSKAAITAMKSDIAQQEMWLEQVIEKKNFHKSELSKLQFMEKTESLAFYHELLGLMMSPEIEDGVLIRFMGFRKTNIRFELYDITKRISLGEIIRKLPDFKRELSDKIDELSKIESKPKSVLTYFLKSKGISS